MSNDNPTPAPDLRARVREVLDAADKMTPGKWIVDRRMVTSPKNAGSYTVIVGPTYENPEDLPQDRAAEIYMPPMPNDMAGIVALNNLGPGVIRALEAENERLQDALDHANMHGAQTTERNIALKAENDRFRAALEEIHGRAEGVEPGEELDEDEWATALDDITDWAKKALESHP
jgi:hypothetical protein